MESTDMMEAQVGRVIERRKKLVKERNLFLDMAFSSFKLEYTHQKHLFLFRIWERILRMGRKIKSDGLNYFFCNPHIGLPRY